MLYVVPILSTAEVIRCLLDRSLASVELCAATAVALSNPVPFHKRYHYNALPCEAYR